MLTLFIQANIPTISLKPSWWVFERRLLLLLLLNSKVNSDFCLPPAPRHQTNSCTCFLSLLIYLVTQTTYLESLAVIPYSSIPVNIISVQVTVVSQLACWTAVYLDLPLTHPPNPLYFNPSALSSEHSPFFPLQVYLPPQNSLMPFSCSSLSPKGTLVLPSF